MPKHNLPEPEREQPKKKARRAPLVHLEPEAVARLDDFLNDAKTLNKSWENITSKFERLEQILTKIESSPRTEGNKDPFTEVTVTTGYSVTKTVSSPGFPTQEGAVVGIYHDLDTANKAAVIVYKNIHGKSDWRINPIANLGIDDSTLSDARMVDRIEDRGTSSGWLTRRAGEHQYFHLTGSGRFYRICVQPYRFWSESTVELSKDAASDLPWIVNSPTA